LGRSEIDNENNKNFENLLSHEKGREQP